MAQKSVQLAPLFMRSVRSLKGIMKTSIKLNFLTVLLIPIIICMFSYWAVSKLETPSRYLPAIEDYEFVKDTQDIDKLRAFSALSLDVIKDTNKDNLEALNSFLHFLIAISILSILCTLTIFSYSRKQASNKSLKTAAAQKTRSAP
jgi:hypothetical protein